MCNKLTMEGSWESGHAHCWTSVEGAGMVATGQELEEKNNHKLFG